MKLKNLLIMTLNTVFLLLALIGCGHDHGVSQSRSVSTFEMSADMHVSYYGSNQVIVEAMLNDGSLNSGQPIYIESGDSLRASSIGNPGQLTINDDLFSTIDNFQSKISTLSNGERRIFNDRVAGIWYITRVSIDDIFTPVYVALFRDNNVSATGSNVTLPENFLINNPIVGQTYSRGSDSILVTWSPSNSGNTMILSANTACNNGGSNTWNANSPITGDPGSFTIPANTLAGLTGLCTTTIILERSRSGTLDPTFGMGGRIVGHQYRSVTIDTTE